jgi:hypothetical protein
MANLIDAILAESEHAILLVDHVRYGEWRLDQNAVEFFAVPRPGLDR